MGHDAAASRFDITCPHCRRLFSAPLIRGSAARYSGFKCPHCKLFVPVERTDDAPQREAS